MELMQKIWSMAKSDLKRIVLPEGNEERTLKACEKIKGYSLANIKLIGSTTVIKAKAVKLGVNLDGIEIIDPETSDLIDRYSNEFYELRKNKGMTIEKSKETLKDPLYFATMMLKLGDADGLVSGAIHTTGDLLRPGLQIIKTAPGVSVVSSFFIMFVPNCEYGEDGMLVFSDCAVNPNPSAEELASIAIATADTTKIFVISNLE